MHEQSLTGTAGDAGSIEEAILRALADTRLDVRSEAVDRAARVVDPGDLLKVVADPVDATRRNGAIEALTIAGPRSVPALVRALEDPDAEVAMFAASILGKMRDASVVSHLMKLLEHDDINVVQAAIDSLAQLRASVAVDALLAMLDRDPWLRFAAVHALGRIGHPKAVGALLRLVNEEGMSDAVVDALGEIGSAEALDGLLVLLRDAPDHGAFVVRLSAVGRVLRRHPGEDRLRRAGPLSAIAGEGSTLQRSLLRVLSDEKPGAPHEAREGAVAVVRAFRLRTLYTAVVWATRDRALWDVAIYSAMAIGEDIAPALAVGLASAEGQVKRFACLCAGMLRLPSLAAGVAPLLGDADAAIRAAAIEALARVSHLPAVAPIARSLDDEADEVHVAAVVALSRMDAAAVTGALQADLPPTRRAIRGALDVMRANPDRAQRAIIEACLVDHEPSVRRAAVGALSAQSSPEAIEDLMSMLGDPAPEVRREALTLLAGSRHPRVREVLVAQLASDAETRADAACALGRLGDPTATPALVAHYDTAPPLVRLAILDALADLAEPSAGPLLVRLLEDEDAEVRRSAVVALARMGTPIALAYLAFAARDDHWEVRATVVEVLAGDAALAMKATLEQLCLDDNPLVASRARRRLEDLEDD
jgi:HEAT repeat protein